MEITSKRQKEIEDKQKNDVLAINKIHLEVEAEKERNRR